MATASSGTRANGHALYVRDARGRATSTEGGTAVLEWGLPFTADSVLNAASVAKQFTALLTHRAVHEGKISLADSVSRWIGDFPLGAGIQVAHCVNHTSGLRDIEALLPLMGIRTNDFYTRTDIMSVARRQRTLIADPGRLFSYSNTGYIILGLILEEVYSEPLDELAQRLIFGPTGMGSTHIDMRSDTVVPRRAASYVTTAGITRRADRAFSLPGGSALMTTVRDLSTWVDQRSAVIRGLDVDPLVLIQSQQGVEGFSPDLSYGAGVFVERLFDVPVRWVHHGGHEQGYSTQAMVSDRGEVVISVSNQQEVDAAQAAYAAARTLLINGDADRALSAALLVRRRQMSVPTHEPTHEREPAVHLERWVGHYVSCDLPRPVVLDLDDNALVFRRGAVQDSLSVSRRSGEKIILQGPGYTLTLLGVPDRDRAFELYMPRVGSLRFDTA